MRQMESIKSIQKTVYETITKHRIPIFVRSDKIYEESKIPSKSAFIKHSRIKFLV